MDVDKERDTSLVGPAWTGLFLVFGCPKAPAAVAAGDRGVVLERIDAYRHEWLASARIPPPSVGQREARVEDGELVAVARFVRPEEAPWNRWGDGSSRLFNNRAAVLFDISVRSTGGVRWDPTASRLEVNDERTVLVAAPSAEMLLAELLFHAYLEEVWSVEGDLVHRTRSAGPFRAAYLPAEAEEQLAGVVAFPLATADRAVWDMHVVAMRLTLRIDAQDGPHDVVFVFD